MNFSTDSGHIPHKKRAEDIGIDLPQSSYGAIVLEPHENRVIDTGVRFKFPIFGKARRFLTKLLLGVEIVGVAGLLWPRGKHDTLVMAGVVDASYRGTVKVRLYNPTDELVTFRPNDTIAQLVPVLSIDTPLKLDWDGNIESDTDRGTAGGINAIR